jgi:hypothetical protein
MQGRSALDRVDGVCDGRKGFDLDHLWRYLCTEDKDSMRGQTEMATDAEAFELKKKAIEIIKKRGVYESINWIAGQRALGLSEQVRAVSQKSERDFEKCQKYYAFEFNNHKYELFFENGHVFHTPDDSPYWGDVRFLFNDELVFKLQYEKEYSEYGSQFRLISIERVVEVLRLGDWVDEITTLTNIEKEAAEADRKQKKAEENAKEADKIRKNFDLGKFA